MHKLYQVGSDLVNQIALHPTNEKLVELFEVRTKYWPHPYMEVEGGGISQFGDLFDVIQEYQSFIMIDFTVDLCLMQDNEDLFRSALWLLDGLTRKSNTTEMPDALKMNFKNLQLKKHSFNKDSTMQLAWESLLKWYRINERSR